MRKALVVGINDYPTAPLRGCVNDANAIASALSTNGDGSPNFDINILTSPGNDTSRSSIRENVEKLFSGDSSVALFYFSGHGTINSTGGYIVTSDYKRFDEGIPMDAILTLANGSKAKDKVIILDCCHSGAFGSPATSGSMTTQIADNVTVLTASRDSESSLEVNGCGLFTSLVVGALSGGASDICGNITPGSIYSYVDQALGAWDQRPIFKTNVSHFTVLRKISPLIDLSALRKICNYFINPTDEFPLDPTYEFTQPSHDPAKVVIFKDLQKFERVGLVVPIGEEHMYYAAINSKSCKLTALGYQYWRLVNGGKI